MRTSLIFSAAFLSLGFLHAQDTFSICAVDLSTGEVGSAGASCIANCIIISDMHPGVGVIHTQSYWNGNNQNYARSLMNSGHSPQQIMDSLQAHDVQNNPAIRQYGAVDLLAGGRSAAFTGTGCFDYKNHITGPVYAIQGNILLGQQILDSMESRFLNEPGDLAHKLMAALQGANVPGADTRCMNNGTPSISSFIRVARPGDTLGTYTLDLQVNNPPVTVNPIDSLQHLFDTWVLTGENMARPISAGYRLSPHPLQDVLRITPEDGGYPDQPLQFIVTDVQGKVVWQAELLPASAWELEVPALPAGLYLYQISGSEQVLQQGKLVEEQ